MTRDLSSSPSKTLVKSSSNKSIETPGPGAYLNTEETIDVQRKKSCEVKFPKAQRFNKAGVRGIAGIYGPGPKYFVEKLASIDSTHKQFESNVFKKDKRWSVK